MAETQQTKQYLEKREKIIDDITAHYFPEFYRNAVHRGFPRAIYDTAYLQGAAAPSLPSCEELARKMWEGDGAAKVRMFRWEEFRNTERGKDYLGWAKDALKALAALSSDKVSKELVGLEPDENGEVRYNTIRGDKSKGKS